VNAIETSRLGRRYGKVWAVHACTLAIPAGRIAALVGPNGAGKTTLLHLVVGLSTPQAGHIRVVGEAVPGSRQALDEIGFVAQDTPLYPNLSVADTLRLASNLGGHLDIAYAHQRLAALHIGLDRKVNQLSGGQHAQVALAVALARHPRLLVLDEPLAKLDPLARHDFMATLMAAVAEEQISVLFSSHVVAELERVCDYLVVLADGKVQVAGDVEELIDSHRILTGRTEDVNAVAATLAVVHEDRGARQTRLLVRCQTNFVAPPGWQAASTNLEELVLSYLREPTATALPGPATSTGATARTA
jgi:ABC-2 type transport system ATP-binding protein